MEGDHSLTGEGGEVMQGVAEKSLKKVTCEIHHWKMGEGAEGVLSGINNEQEPEQGHKTKALRC